MKLGKVVPKTDTGRRRRNNEDVYVCSPPLFAIADGMGGAQAGEVASGLTAEVLREHASYQGSAEERVRSLIQEANRRVYERASEDAEFSGMGTTLTLALVDGPGVVFGHVGDSRAYLLRDGELQQVTDDHSLVAELTRAGKLSEEEAETHPQRSVITRALGTDPDVDGDVFTVEPQSGDVFLLCSDGLSDMVDDRRIEEILRKNRRDLDKAAQALVRAANRSGGEDNITMLIFEIADAEERERTVENVVPVEPAEDEADEDTLSEVDAIPVVTAREERRDDWDRDGDAPSRTVRRREPERHTRRRLYWLVAGLLILVLVGLSLFGLSQSHFVGAEGDGHVAVYQGVPYDIAGVKLYRSVYLSPLLAAQLTQSERRRLFDHDLRGYGSARDAVTRYENEITSFDTATPTATTTATTATATAATTTTSTQTTGSTGRSTTRSAGGRDTVAGPGQPRPANEQEGGP